MSTLTATQQRNAAPEGMAFGLTQLGRWTLPYDKVRVDLAFTGAWRSWPHKARYPQVNTDLSKGSDGARVMTRADESKRTFAFFWVTGVGDGLSIVSRQNDWNPDDPAEIAFAQSVIDDQVPPAAWASLAQEFLSRYER